MDLFYIFSTIKRKFNGTITTVAQKLSNKETKLKNIACDLYRSTKSTKKKGFYKADFF